MTKEQLATKIIELQAELEAQKKENGQLHDQIYDLEVEISQRKVLSTMFRGYISVLMRDNEFLPPDHINEIESSLGSIGNFPEIYNRK